MHPLLLLRLLQLLRPSQLPHRPFLLLQLLGPLMPPLLVRLKVPPLLSLAKSPPIRGGTLLPEDAPLALFKDGKLLTFIGFYVHSLSQRHNVLPLVSGIRGACYTRQAGREEAEAAFAQALTVPGLVKEL